MSFVTGCGRSLTGKSDRRYVVEPDGGLVVGPTVSSGPVRVTVTSSSPGPLGPGRP